MAVAIVIVVVIAGPLLMVLRTISMIILIAIPNATSSAIFL